MKLCSTKNDQHCLVLVRYEKGVPICRKLKPNFSYYIANLEEVRHGKSALYGNGAINSNYTVDLSFNFHGKQYGQQVQVEWIMKPAHES